MDKLFYRSDSQKKYVGKIFDKILDERYPGKATDIDLDKLLSWDMWQTFIKILGKCSVFSFIHLLEMTILRNFSLIAAKYSMAFLMMQGHLGSLHAKQQQ